MDAEARAAVDYLEQRLDELTQETTRHPLGHFDELAEQFDRVKYRGGGYDFHGQDLTVQPIFTIKDDHPEGKPGIPKCLKCHPYTAPPAIAPISSDLLAERLAYLIEQADNDGDY